MSTTDMPTKVEMAQTIVRVLNGWMATPSPEHGEVKRMARAKKAHLADHYERALRVEAERRENLPDLKEALDVAFAQLREQYFIAEQNFMCCMGCATAKLDAMVKEKQHADVVGCAYYHGQDVRGLADGRIVIRYCDARDEGDEAMRATGHIVAAVLRGAGLLVHWSGDPSTVIVAEGQPSPGHDEEDLDCDDFDEEED